jgi:two-component system, cell cycle response regulator
VQSRKILVIDQDPASTEIIKEILTWENYAIDVCTHESEASLILDKQAFDLVLLESSLDLKILKKVKESPSFVPVVLVSHNNQSETVVQGLNAGADDCIAKPFAPTEFLARIRAQLRIKDLTDNLHRTNLKLQELVEIDDLTGLFNMRSMYQKLELEIQRSKRYQRLVCVVMMDMDHFKSVNDGHDHLFGSFVLSEVGNIIRHSTRNIDIPARYGGDEFLIVLTETHTEGAIAFCERLRHTIESFHFIHGQDQIRLTTSLGFAITSPTEVDINAKSLVREADHALYESKRSGRNQTSYRELFGSRKKLKKVS